MLEDKNTFLAMQQLCEVAEIGLQQIKLIEKDPQNQNAPQILDQVDRLILEISHYSPRLNPLIDWFQTERIRIGPGDLGTIISATKRKFEDLIKILSLYVPLGQLQNEEIKNELR